jgi:hypothetical protein
MMAAINLTRRSVLAGLGATTAVAFPVSLTAQETESESPQILDAWAAFNEALAEYDVAYAAKEEAKSLFESIAPHVPAALRCRNSRTLGDGWQANGYVAERLQDGDGKDIHDPKTGCVYVADAHQIGLTLSHMDGRWASSKHLKRLQVLAKKFDEGRSDARSASGLADAQDRFYRAESKLRRAGEDMQNAPALTARGVAIKAAAIVTSISRDETFGSTYMAYGPRFAQAVHDTLGGLIDV